MKKRYGSDGPPQLHNIAEQITESDFAMLKRSGVKHLLAVEACWLRGIKCECECKRLLVLRADSNLENWIVGKYSGRQRVRVKCQKCGNSYLLFDDGLHGYNAVVCGERSELPPDYEKNNETLLESFQCPCGNESFRVYAAAVYDCLSPEESDDMPIEQWDEAYGYFEAIAVCLNCASTHELASEETA